MSFRKEPSAEPVALETGSRTIVVDGTPMATSSSGHCDKNFSKTFSGGFVIRPNLKGRLSGLVLMVVSIIMLGVTTVALVMGYRTSFFALSIGIVLSVFFIPFGLLLFVIGCSAAFSTRSFRFEQRQVCYGPIWYRRTRSQKDIVAVQLLPHKPTDKRAPFGQYYELNLVFDDEKQPRVNVSSHGDLDWTRVTAKQLASFLGVPVVNQIDLEKSITSQSQPNEATMPFPGVEMRPLSVASANYRTKTLAQPSANVLVIKPSIGDRIFSLVFTFIGLAAFVVGICAFAGIIMNIKGSPRGIAWAFTGMGALFASIGMAMFYFAKSFQFDRLRGTLMTRKETRRLREILAVQVIYGGYHRGSKGSGYETYQLNLVFNDAEKSRMNLSNHAVRSWTETAGMQLAKFLNVPLLNQIQVSRG